MKNASRVRVAGRELVLSNLDKTLYPETGFTKAQLIDYYARIAPVILAHVRGRPLTLKRYPDGVSGEFFYEKNCPSFRPKWIRTKSVPRTSVEDRVNYCVLTDAASLLWVANLASIELHVLLSTAARLDEPLAMAFDLDPGPGADLLDAAWAALEVRDLFDSFGLRSFAKSSGKKGIHVYVPLNSGATYEGTKSFAHAVALLLEKKFPERVVSNMRKNLRPGKVFVDWSQNDDHKTTVAPYSLRATGRPAVSTPVAWEEVERAVERKDAGLLAFEPAAVLERVAARGDLFAPVLTRKQRLPREPASLPSGSSRRSAPA